jgi:hypothetical protein
MVNDILAGIPWGSAIGFFMIGPFFLYTNLETNYKGSRAL